MRSLGLGCTLVTGYHGEWWSDKEIKLLGTLPDADVGNRSGRTQNAVRIKREQMGLPRPESTTWTAEELSHLGTATDVAVAKRIGRTPSAVAQKRIALGIPRRGRRGGPDDDRGEMAGRHRPDADAGVPAGEGK
jgi:hypothetical protein